MVDWTNPKSHVSAYFTVNEALYLPQWKRMAAVKDGLSDTIYANLVKSFTVMDVVRHFVNRPIIVHVAFRSKSYNALVKGAPQSAHITGQAVDFHVEGLDCDAVRAMILPMLDKWGVRCENLPGSSWVHIDIRPVGPGMPRFFKP